MNLARKGKTYDSIHDYHTNQYDAYSIEVVYSVKQNYIDGVLPDFI